MINISHTNHLPFAQLPIEAKVLFYIQSMSAWQYHCNWPHTAAEVYRDLERIWNAAGLTPEDLRDGQRMSTLLETELSKCIPQDAEPDRAWKKDSEEVPAIEPATTLSKLGAAASWRPAPFRTDSPGS